MRRIAALSVILFLTACDFGPDTPTAVDTGRLSPMTGREQSLLLAAESAVRQGNMEAAEKDYLSAISASTGHVEAHVALAQLYTRMKQPARAREILDKALEIQPNNSGANYLRGKLDVAMGDYPAALAAFTRGLVNAPGDLDLSNGAGIAHDMQGHHPEAQSVYTRAIAQNKGKNLSAIRTNLAMSYLLSGDAKRALPLLKVEAKNPTASTVIRHDLALAYGLLGDKAAARATLKDISDEPTRIATLARLKEYLADKTPNKTPPQLTTPGILAE